MQSVGSDFLIRKYDTPVPRYTSYPTVPFWDVDSFRIDAWKESIRRIFASTNSTKGISLYIHLPFCESLCTYCACNMRISRNHGVEPGYIRALLKEWKMYRELFGESPTIREIHLGGGTPTFFSPPNLKLLLSGIMESSIRHDEYAFSFEGHPNNTSSNHLQTLYDLGFRRVSFGVQDLDVRVQQAIHRIQPFKNLQRVTEQSRKIGYTSVSFDLVYGLPYQTILSIEHTIQKVVELRPDRISFYSYAHVPWLRPGQRGFEDADLPSDVAKRNLYEHGRMMLHKAGYIDIGMDHFALPMDELATAQRQSRLHRNFMGYTVTQTDLLVGLGASSISDAHFAYAQNAKKVEEYEAAIGRNELPVFKGHIQSEEDLETKRSILDLACHGFLEKNMLERIMDDEIAKQLATMGEEGIVERTAEGLRITNMGRPFVRNICSAFDRRMRNKLVDQVFSKSI